ncbi:hypothetical protein [Azospirillum soli]|uniref:hypothetical protein n=1 Tax=Azospirillum soli TaxID=1304799 RepID=UPI001AE7F226|nr:hypothetical protein [Azospirillum soli]MBP2315978.1 hypothetical protein [Azospirillum soli]
MDVADSDRVTVEYEVVAVERFGRGPILAVASVLIDIAGVHVLIEGITMRRAEGGQADITVPTYRHPRTGEWKPALDLPAKVWAAISVEVAERATGRVAQLVP